MPNNKPSIDEKLYERYKAIEYLAFWEGGVNASRLSRLFGVQANVISKAITNYRKHYPDALVYMPSDPEKLFVATNAFETHFIRPQWADYIQFMLAVGSHYIEGLYGPDAFHNAVTPLATPSPVITRVLLKAIRNNAKATILYKSRTHPEGLKRDIMPQQLSHDGLRWHCRAYCCRRDRFSDFNLGRISDIVMTEKGVTLPAIDTLWHQYAPIQIAPHPSLNETEKMLVLNDYGQTAPFVIKARCAMVDYTLQYYRLGRHGIQSDPRQHPLIVANIEALRPYLFEQASQ